MLPCGGGGVKMLVAMYIMRYFTGLTLQFTARLMQCQTIGHGNQDIKKQF
jgi:hypothetical protein